MSRATTIVWRELLHELLSRGAEVAPASAGGDWRGRTTKELIGYQTRVDMTRPVVAAPLRKLGYRFLAAEAAWVLSGDNQLATIEPYAKNLRKLSDDGRTLSGAYGPPFITQVPYVVQTLAADSASRQAVIVIFHPRPGRSNDVACTLTLQWLIRAGKLNCVATMRSSDAWMGWVYDVFTFSMMSAYVALAMRDYDRCMSPNEPIRHAKPADLQLGTLYLTAGSQHLYKIDEELAQECVNDDEVLFDVEPIDLYQFESPNALISQLWCVANRVDDGKWLRELL